MSLGGAFSDTPGGNISSIVKPLSAIIESPDSYCFKIPHSLVSFLSEILPPYKSDMKQIALEGVIPINAFRVFVVIFVVGEGELLSCGIGWHLNINFSSINDVSCLRI